MKKITLIVLAAIISGCSTQSESSEMVAQTPAAPQAKVAYTGYEIRVKDFKGMKKGFISHLVVTTDNTISMRDTAFQRIILDSAAVLWGRLKITHNYKRFVGVTDSVIQDNKMSYTVELTTE